MELKTYIKQSGLTRAEFAKLIEVKLTYLHNICQHPEQCGQKTFRKIHIVTKGAVTDKDMWGNKWPQKTVKSII